MKVYIRCATVALLLLGSAGMAAAQKYPTGTPGTNDHMITAPVTSGTGSSTQSSAQNQTGTRVQNQTGNRTSSQRHARTVKQNKSAMSARGSAALPSHRRVQKHAGSATQKQSGY